MGAPLLLARTGPAAEGLTGITGAFPPSRRGWPGIPAGLESVANNPPSTASPTH